MKLKKVIENEIMLTGLLFKFNNKALGAIIRYFKFKPIFSIKTWGAFKIASFMFWASLNNVLFVKYQSWVAASSIDILLDKYIRGLICITPKLNAEVFSTGAHGMLSRKWLLSNLEDNGCKIIGDNKVRKFYNKKIKKAKESDWSKEYLSSIVSVKFVKNIDGAINHINKYGTMHTDAIITQNLKSAKKFLNGVKSSIAMHNTSTQFADGEEFGFGGEIGISTNTLPPRGPVGLNQLVSYKYKVSSKGKVRD